MNQSAVLALLEHEQQRETQHALLNSIDPLFRFEKAPTQSDILYQERIDDAIEAYIHRYDHIINTQKRKGLKKKDRMEWMKSNVPQWARAEAEDSDNEDEVKQAYEKMSKRTSQMETTLNHLFREYHLPHDLTVYRGIQHSHLDFVQLGYFLTPSVLVLPQKGYLSTSIYSYKAKQFQGRSECCFLIINAPAGTPALYIDRRNEGEVLFPPGANLVVDFSKTTKRGTHYATLTYDKIIK